jgi:hypothetical protein
VIAAPASSRRPVQSGGFYCDSPSATSRDSASPPSHPLLHTIFFGQRPPLACPRYTRIVGRTRRVRLTALAILAGVVIAYRSNQWFAAELAHELDYVRNRGDSVASEIADRAEEGAATLRCLSCLGAEASSVVRSSEDAVANSSIYTRLKRHLGLLVEKAPCEQISPQTPSASGMTGSAAPRDATQAAERTCG